jgi:hypothetical protein
MQQKAKTDEEVAVVFDFSTVSDVPEHDEVCCELIRWLLWHEAYLLNNNLDGRHDAELAAAATFRLTLERRENPLKPDRRKGRFGIFDGASTNNDARPRA